jgi:DNA polymerase-1
MNIKWLEHPRFEADDIIASMAVSWTQKFGNVYISSNDFDFVQMVSDKIYLIRSVQGKLINCDERFIKQKFNIKPDQYVEYLSMVGDKTDNIAGVTGVGPKTASDLLNQYGNIDKIFEHAYCLPNGIQKKLVDGRDLINRNQKFITMKKDISDSELFDGELPPTMPERVQQKIAIYLRKISIR